MTVELISVGTEILLGNIVNTNAAWLSKACADLGLSMYAQSVVGDNDSRLAEVFSQAFKRSDVVILGGGLGPTEDDLTKETVAKALGIPLIRDEKAVEDMEVIFSKLNYTPTDNNYKQALVPEGCIVMYNRNGTAPGIIVEQDGHTAILLPGPPGEMIPMFQEYAQPYLRAKSGKILHSVTIKECGIGESLLETKLLDLIDGQTNPTIATYAKTGYCEVRVTAQADSQKEVEALVEPVVKTIRQRLKHTVFTLDDSENLEDAVVRLLRKYDLKIATAESCTGGMVAARLVNVPGASDVFTHGFITYSNKAKRKVLGVSRDTLKTYSAVSKEVAKEMVKGCLFTADADVAVAITGYAGPSDTKEEPAGLVYIACLAKGEITVEKFHFSGNRQKVRENATIKALDLVRNAIMAEYK